MARLQPPPVQSIVQAFTLNRYLVQATETFKKTQKKTTKYHVQWKNIKSDLSNPIKFAPQIAVAVLALFFVLIGKPEQSVYLTFLGAINYDAAGASTTNGEPTSITYSITIGSGSNRYVIWGVQGFGQTLSSTFDSNAGTVVIDKSGDQKVWGYLNPGSGSKDIVISTGGGGSIMASTAVSFDGVDQTTPTGATNYAENANPRSIGLTTTTANAIVVIMAVAINDSASDITSSIDSGTQRAQKNNAHNQFRIFHSVFTDPQASAGAQTRSVTFTNAGFYQIVYAVEIIAASGGGGATIARGLASLGAGR